MSERLQLGFNLIERSDSYVLYGHSCYTKERYRDCTLFLPCSEEKPFSYKLVRQLISDMLDETIAENVLFLIDASTEAKLELLASQERLRKLKGN